MEYAIGIVLALAVSALATTVGFDRDRAFYPVVLMVIASYYGLFAIMGGSTVALMTESIVIAAFVSISILGFKLNLWFVVAALIAHGLFDFVHALSASIPIHPAGAFDFLPTLSSNSQTCGGECRRGLLRWRHELLPPRHR